MPLMRFMKSDFHVISFEMISIYDTLRFLGWEIAFKLSLMWYKTVITTVFAGQEGVDNIKIILKTSYIKCT